MADSNKTISSIAAKTAKSTIEKTDEQSEPKDKLVTVSTGVVFRIKEVPQMAFMDLRSSLPEPTPPIFFNADYDRDEPNFNDPIYLSKKQNWGVALMSAMMDMQIILGTEVVTIPKNIPAPNSEEFGEVLKIMLRGIGYTQQEIKDIGHLERYLYWVKYKGTKGDLNETGGDMEKLFREVSRESGVPEDDVADAMDTFQN